MVLNFTLLKLSLISCQANVLIDTPGLSEYFASSLCSYLLPVKLLDEWFLLDTQDKQYCFSFYLLLPLLLVLKGHHQFCVFINKRGESRKYVGGVTYSGTNSL